MPVHYVCHRMDSCGGKCWYDNLIAEGYGGIVGNTNDATVEQCLNTSAQLPAISLPHTEHIGAIRATRWAARSATTYTNGVAYNDYLVTYPDAKYPAKSMLL